MGHKIISISLTEEDSKYLNDDSELKPSLIFRSALKMIKENRHRNENKEKLYLNKIRLLQEEVFKLQDVLEKQKKD